jgi:hypothetical protein
MSAGAFRTGRARQDLRCVERTRYIARQAFEFSLFLTLRPPKVSRRSSQAPTEVTGQMTLVRKANGVRDFC